MKKNFVKKLALGLALVMAVTSVPATSEAAAKPGFKSTKVTVKEGQTKKYNTKNASKYSVKFKIGNKAVATIKYSAGSKAVKVTGVAEGKTTLRADFKSYKTKKVTTVKVPVTVKAEKTEVKTFAATASKTITLTGTALNKLTQADVTVAGYNVTAFNATKTTATITLDRMMVPNTDVAVTVGGFAGTVKYNLTVNSLAVVAGAFDDDLAGQVVKFTVNGEQIEAQDMLNCGYTVAFTAKEKYSNTEYTTFFANPELGVINTDGTVGAKVVQGTYLVKVTVSNGTTVVTSDYVEINIVDLDARVNSIDSYELTNLGTGLVQNSTTLVVGETADFTKVLVTVDGQKGIDVNNALTYVTSSNPAVVSVANGTWVLTAETSGTATITIGYGTATKTVNVTVVTAARTLSSAKAVKKADYKLPGHTSTSVVSASTGAAIKSLYIVPLDQYGDPMNKDVYAASTNKAVANVTDPVDWSTAVTATAGLAELKITVPANAKGYTNIIVRDKAITSTTNQTNTKTLLTFAYTVVDNDTVASKKLAIVPATLAESTDAALDLNSDKETTLVLEGYNAAGVYVKDLDLNGYTLSSTNADVVSIDSADNSESKYTVSTASAKVIANKLPGTATVTLKETASGDIVARMTFTVTTTQPTLTGVTFKAASTVIAQNATIDYNNFFTVTKTDGTDDILSGITVSGSSTSKIRLAADGTIYLDRNDDGALDNPYGTSADVNKPADIKLGTVEIKPTSDSQNISIVTDGVKYSTTVGSKGYVKAVVKDVYGTIKATTTIAVNVPNVQ